MSSHLPLIIGYGGINAAGISSTCQGYRNMVFSALKSDHQQALLSSLNALAGNQEDTKDASVRDDCFIRPINKDTHFDPIKMPYYRINKKRQPFPVSFAAPLAVNFNPGDCYKSRSHPRGLKMTVFAVADALNASGLSPGEIRRHTSADRIAVYAGSSLGQLDADSMGGVLTAHLKKLKTVTKHLPFSYPQMSADFINAYILKNTGITGNSCGACATFLYNLAAATQGIKSGALDLAVVGASEAPILPEVIAAFYNMGAMVGDAHLMGKPVASAAIPFGDNQGFVMGESAQFVLLASEDMVRRSGAVIHGMVSDVFVSSDGMKRSISAPGPGNYITLAKAAYAMNALHGENAVRKKSCVFAHGTSTPQNRVTESHILSCVAEAFKMDDWPVLAIKSLIGHSQGASGGDQLATAMGLWKYGIFPGIANLNTPADDVHTKHLRFLTSHAYFDESELEAVFINSKGFGGNNATALISSPETARKHYIARIGKKTLKEGLSSYEKVLQASLDYQHSAERGQWNIFYDFAEELPSENDIKITNKEITIGNSAPISLHS